MIEFLKLLGIFCIIPAIVYYLFCSILGCRKIKKKTKLIPFDVNKAKAGAKVVTKNGFDVRIVAYDREDKSYPIIALVKKSDGFEKVMKYTECGYCNWPTCNGELDLFIKEEIKTRRMTNQEFSWWLRDHPEEHREYYFDGEYYRGVVVRSQFDHNKGSEDKEVRAGYYIRKNGGEWQEPELELDDR